MMDIRKNLQPKHAAWREYFDLCVFPGFDYKVPRTEQDAEAKIHAALEMLLEERWKRIEKLGVLVEPLGLELDFSDTSLRPLNVFYYDNVDRNQEHERKVLSIEWIEVGADIAVYLTECILKKFPNLHWQVLDYDDKDVFPNLMIGLDLSSEENNTLSFLCPFEYLFNYGYDIINNRVTRSDLIYDNFVSTYHGAELELYGADYDRLGHSDDLADLAHAYRKRLNP